MSISNRHAYWIILASFALALVLTIMPLPEWARSARPDWVALVLIYWCLALPDRVGIGIAFCVGLLADVLIGSLLGQHALGLILIAYIAVHLHNLIRVYPLRQQALFVLLLLLLNQLAALWIMGLTGSSPGDWLYFLPSIIGTLLWPWIYFLMRDLRRRFKVS